MTSRRRALVVLVVLLAPAPAVAHGYEEPPARDRGDWAVLLTGYLALTAVTVGGAYLLRNDVVGRSLAVGAAGWGGLAVGGAAGWSLARLRCGGAPAVDPSCAEAQDEAATVGALLGAAAATVAAILLTGDAGTSRTYTAAAGMAPGLLYLTTATIIDW